MINTLFWCDLETDNLEPVGGHILEASAIVTDYDLNVLAEYSSLVKHADVEAIIGAAHPKVFEMHKANGLWVELLNGGGKSLDEVERELVFLIEDHGCSGPGYSAPLAGSSVQFDRAWLKVHCPKVLSKLHYRNVDVSTVMQLVENWYKVPRSPSASKHRALDVIRASIEHLRHYRAHYFSPYNRAAGGLGAA